MTTTTFTATHNGATFTTKSVRDVQYAVVAIPDQPSVREAEVNAAAWVRRVEERATNSDGWDAWTLEELTTARERAIAELEKVKLAAAERRPLYASFHKSYALAVKEATKNRLCRGFYTHVVVPATKRAR